MVISDGSPNGWISSGTHYQVNQASKIANVREELRRFLYKKQVKMQGADQSPHPFYFGYGGPQVPVVTEPGGHSDVTHQVHPNFRNLPVLEPNNNSHWNPVPAWDNDQPPVLEPFMNPEDRGSYLTDSQTTDQPQSHSGQQVGSWNEAHLQPSRVHLPSQQPHYRWVDPSGASATTPSRADLIQKGWSDLQLQQFFASANNHQHDSGSDNAHLGRRTFKDLRAQCRSGVVRRLQEHHMASNPKLFAPYETPITVMDNSTGNIASYHEMIKNEGHGQFEGMDQQMNSTTSHYLGGNITKKWTDTSNLSGYLSSNFDAKKSINDNNISKHGFPTTLDIINSYGQHPPQPGRHATNLQLVDSANHDIHNPQRQLHSHQADIKSTDTYNQQEQKNMYMSHPANNVIYHEPTNHRNFNMSGFGAPNSQQLHSMSHSATETTPQSSGCVVNADNTILKLNQKMASFQEMAHNTQQKNINNNNAPKDIGSMSLLELLNRRTTNLIDHRRLPIRTKSIKDEVTMTVQLHPPSSPLPEYVRQNRQYYYYRRRKNKDSEVESDAKRPMKRGPHTPPLEEYQPVQFDQNGMVANLSKWPMSPFPPLSMTTPQLISSVQAPIAQYQTSMGYPQTFLGGISPSQVHPPLQHLMPIMASCQNHPPYQPIDQNISFDPPSTESPPLRPLAQFTKDSRSFGLNLSVLMTSLDHSHDSVFQSVGNQMEVDSNDQTPHLGNTDEAESDTDHGADETDNSSNIGMSPTESNEGGNFNCHTDSDQRQPLQESAGNITGSVTIEARQTNIYSTQFGEGIGLILNAVKSVETNL